MVQIGWFQRGQKFKATLAPHDTYILFYKSTNSLFTILRTHYFTNFAGNIRENSQGEIAFDVLVPRHSPHQEKDALLLQFWCPQKMSGWSPKIYSGMQVIFIMGSNPLWSCTRPSLKIRTANEIFLVYLETGLNCIF